MRTLLVGILGGLVALVGFATTASAAVTVDLIWATSGTTSTSVTLTSSTATLNIILTNSGPLVSQGGGMTVDYSDAAGKYSVLAFGNNLSGGLLLALGSVTNTGTQIRNMNAAAFVPFVGSGLAVGATYLMGTVTFHKDIVGSGTFAITSLLTATDGFTVLGGAADSPTLNAASLTNVPEPGTVSLLALGLGGLALAARRKN
jgi:hypothetical protein